MTLNGATMISGGKKYVPPQTEAMLHDVAGNRIQDGRWEMRWDNENRLVDVRTSADAITAGLPNQRLRYTYDADGRLFERRRFSWVSGEWSLAETTRYLNDGLQCVAEFNGSNGLLRRQVWGLDLDGSRGGLGGIGGLLWIVSQANGTHYAAPDGSGNVVALFGTSGTETARYEYGPFGELLRMSGTPIAAENPWRFSSKRQDPTTDWVHYEFRVYDPTSGRWLSRDPIGEAGGENLYGFVGNDPVNQVDLFGFCATCPAEEPMESPATRPPPGPVKRVAGWLGGLASEGMDIGWELVKGALYGFDYDYDRNPYGEESWARGANRHGVYENYKDADGNTIRTSELILQVFCMAASAPLEGIGIADDLVRGATWLGRTSRAARTGAGIVKETCEFGKRVAKKSAKAVKIAAKRPLRAAKAALTLAEDSATSSPNVVYRAMTEADAAAIAAGRGITAKAPAGTWTAANHVLNAGPGAGAARMNSPWISTTRRLDVAQAYDSGNGIIAINLNKVPSLKAEVWRSAPRVNGKEGLPFLRSFWADEVTVHQQIPFEAIIGIVE